MKRRIFVAALASSPLCMHAQTNTPDTFGQPEGYPTGWGHPRGMAHDKRTRVGNFSGGFESMLPVNMLHAGTALTLASQPQDVQHRSGEFSRGVAHYLQQRPVTGLLIARGGEIWVEKYQFGRTADMRLTGWSMSKSITSLLLGIALDKGLIASLEDRAARYLPSLAGTLHGETTLRNLCNMSSGASRMLEQLCAGDRALTAVSSRA